MYVISTTNGWNLGDDLIRQGVTCLLGIEHFSKFFINRAQLERGGMLWREQKGAQSPDAVMRHATAFVLAGSPEWWDGISEWWEAALRHGVPVLLCGVGTRQGRIEELARYRHLVRGATTRDAESLAHLRSAGIEAVDSFPDPGFCCPEARLPLGASSGLLVCYRAQGGNGRHTDQYDAYWRQVQEAHGEDIGLVTVHEPGEIALARSIFKAPVFYSSEWRDYLPIYASWRRAIVGRIHAAVPLLVNGATVDILYRSPKISTLRPLALVGDNLTIRSPSEGIPAAPFIRRSSESLTRHLIERNLEHLSYWQQVMKSIS